MAQEPNLDNNGDKVKKEFSIKIAGFTFGKKSVILLLIVIAIIGILTLKGNADREKEEEEQRRIAAEQMAERDRLLSQRGNGETLTREEQLQLELEKEYGIAPEGFKWSRSGKLLSKGDDDSSNAEDVVYSYIRALSILDFSTAARYSVDSSVIDSYKGYYDYASEARTDYYSNFLRKQFKKSIMSIEVNNISDVAVFEDGTKYVTLSVNVLDLTDKDFWRNDKEKLFDELVVYADLEDDSTKLESCVYDYIYSKYEDGTVGKRTVNVELVVSKENNEGWLITSDGELDAVLEYEQGVDVAQYILEDFDDYYRIYEREKVMKEAREARKENK